MNRATLQVSLVDFPGDYDEAKEIIHSKARAFFGDRKYSMEINAYLSTPSKFSLTAHITIEEEEVDSPVTPNVMGGKQVYPPPGAYVPPF